MARDYDKSLASVLSPLRDFFPAPRSRRAAFTLAEAVISILIVAILAIAAGLFAIHAHSRADDTRSTLAQKADCSAFLDRLAADLRWATEISLVSPSYITLTCPDPQDPEDTITVKYIYDSFAHALNRRPSIFSPPTHTLTNVYSCQFEPDTVPDTTPYLAGFTLTLRLLSPGALPLQRYFECRNHPTVD